jgi:beta-phosphoglucomutase-like phosphatase (HAD superfamily)
MQGCARADWRPCPMLRFQMFDALFFDLDGTLIDTESIAVRTLVAALESQGFQADLTLIHSLIGKDEATGDALIAAAYPDADFARARSDWRAGFAAGVEAGLPLKPGAAELLAATALPCVLVTSSQRDSAHRKLAIAGISDAFAHVVTVDDVRSPKPAPDPYLLAASLMQLDPARCLVFEDSETGAESAHRAGCLVVQVPDIVPATGRWAHHVAQDLISGARIAGLTLP